MVSGTSWSSNLREAVKKWAADNGYPDRSVLGKELGIDPKVWGYISYGDSVVTDLEVYAKLYLRTGLAEADPRGIPPRVIKLPRGGTMEEPRAWSNEQYVAWLNVRAAAALRVEPLIDELNRISSELRRGRASRAIEPLLEELEAHLVVFLEGEREEREWLAAEHGHRLLYLVRLIDALANKNGERRERAVELLRRSP